MASSFSLCAKHLIESIHGVVEDTSYDAENGRAKRVEKVLEPYLSESNLLDCSQLEADPSAYRQHVLYVDPDGSFSVVALVWLPGQQTPIHDHVSWCVVGTYLGQEEEVRFKLATVDGETVLVPAEVVSNPQGTTACLLPPGDIHMVRNATTSKVVSIHIYGADVRARGSSIRRCYNLPMGRPSVNPYNHRISVLKATA